MLKNIYMKLMKEISQHKNIVLVGAGKRGKELYNSLSDSDKSKMACFFDNGKEGAYEGIKIIKPCKFNEENCLYVITSESIEIRKALYYQLLYLGVRKEDIFECRYNEKDYDYYAALSEDEYPKEVALQFKTIFGRELSWENPTTFNEIICSEKLYMDDPHRTLLADKYLVRGWVKEKIGERYLTKQYAAWDTADEIDFKKLPSSFVLKTNNGSGRNIIVKNKTQINELLVRSQLRAWENLNHFFMGGLFEGQYKNIPPKIICEEYLEGLAETVYDYNIYCFHGEPEYIWCIKGSHRPGCQASFYDKKWNMQEFSCGYPYDPVEAPCPAQLDEMLALSRILCEDFRQVRVDWYNMPDGRVLFGEMTMASWGGSKKFIPDKYDRVFGELVLAKAQANL